MSRPIKVAFVALGCAKNLVDSEKMLGQLAEAGVAITADQADAEVIVINTCGFLQAARAEAHEEIRRAVRMKKHGRCRRVVVAGCLVQRDGEQLLADVPGIDALVGVHQRDDVVQAALALPPASKAKGKKSPRKPPDLYLGEYHPYVALDTSRLRITPRHYAYLRISEGCNQKCTFCTIPAIRGPMHSKPPEVVLAEARELIADGAVELNLIGQDTSSYGADLDRNEDLASLLRRLDKLDGLRWLRLLYTYPSSLGDALIEAVGQCSRVVKYIDVPLQHINDRILKAMHRRVTRKQIEQLIDRIRARIPGVALRTTLIAGFPGETEAQFAELMDFVRQMRFAALGVFPYSPELDTPAGRMKGQLPEKLRQERTDALMATQQEIAFADAAASRGKVFDVLIDQPIKAGQYAGRHAGQAPEVDSVTYVLGRGLHAGQFVRVECLESQGYDLIGRPTEAKLRCKSK